MRFLVFIAGFLVILANPSYAGEGFSRWLEGLRVEALAQGISPRTVDENLGDELLPLERVLELDRRQPESRLTFPEYRKNAVNPARIERGRSLSQQHTKKLELISHTYGVQSEYVLALWGIETDFGRNTGGFKVIPALATLAYDGRRSSFFRSELMNALKILDDGHIHQSRMKGSWAGAMGQSQFMPSSFLKFAVDYNGDGKRDIWYSEDDVFASIANYLAQSGWRAGERWGRQVRVPDGGIKPEFVGLGVRKPLSFWREIGIMANDGKMLPDVPGMEASLIFPDDNVNGAAFLVYENFRVLMKWNNSRYFATSVGLLADSLM